MATVTAVDFEYLPFVSGDSSAYELDNWQRMPDISIERQPEAAEALEREIAAESARERIGISPLTFVGFAVAVVMLVMMLFSYMQLAQISSESGLLLEQIDRLQEEQAKLKVRYESTFNLDEIEQYAINELGMVSPVASQMNYISFSAPDHAVILGETADEQPGVFGGIGEFLTSISEYFR